MYSGIRGADSACGNRAFCVKDYILLSELMKRPKDAVGLGRRALRAWVNEFRLYVYWC